MALCFPKENYYFSDSQCPLPLTSLLNFAEAASFSRSFSSCACKREFTSAAERVIAGLEAPFTTFPEVTPTSVSASTVL